VALSGSVATSEYIESGGGKWRVVLNWSATQSALNNESEINWELVTSADSGGYVVISELRVTINDEVVYYREPSKHTDGYNGTKLASGSVTLHHNDDGTQKMTVEVEAGIYVWAINTSGSDTFTLKTIARASAIGATDANIGSKSSIIVNKKNASYIHSISYKFGSLSGYITESGGISNKEVKYGTTNISWTVPTSFYDQIPNAKSGICTLTIKTYLGANQIGEAQTDKFTATASRDLCEPSVYGTVVDSNAVTKALTGDEKRLVRYKSTALCTIFSEPKNSATIVQKKIAGTVVSVDTRKIAFVEVSSFSFYAKDSRGYYGSETVESDLVPYVILTCSPEATRTDSTSGNAVLSVSGNYFNGNFGASDNNLQLKYRVMPDGGEYGEYTTVNPTISGNTYYAEVSLSGLDYKQSFTIEVVVSDAIDSIAKTAHIEQGTPVWDMGANDFRINALFRLAEANYGTTLPEYGVKDQIFLLYTNGSWAIKIHDGESWR
jgi:hypothetical protein